MSFEQSIDKDTKGAFLTRKYIKDVQDGDGGMIDTLISILMNYLNNNMAKFKQSATSTGATVTLFQSFPFDDFTIPSVVVEATNVRTDVNWVGGIYCEEEGKNLNTVRGEVEVTFDMFGRNSREKNSISGWVTNTLYRGLWDMELRKNGIRHMEFIRSVDRGYDQADRVLQFHTHSPSSEIIFRQLVTYRFIFDWVITPRSDEGWSTPNYIKTIGVDTNEEGEQEYTQLVVYVPINFTLT